MGRHEEAIAVLQEVRKLWESNTRLLADLGYAYSVAGERSEAQKLLDELNQRSKQQYVAPYGIAQIYVGLGEKDRAFEWLERAYLDRNWLMAFLKVEPAFDPLRSDPRFRDLLRRIGLLS